VAQWRVAGVRRCRISTLRPLASGMVSSKAVVRSGHASDRGCVSGEIVASSCRIVGSSRSSRGRAGRPGRPVCPGGAGSRTLQMTRPVRLPRTISTSRLSGYRLLHEETCPPVPARGQAPPQCPVTLSEAPANPHDLAGIGWMPRDDVIQFDLSGHKL
jgi:hypothetical protein